MSLLSFVFIAIFSVIYILTAVSGERDLSFTLNRIMKEPPRQLEGPQKKFDQLPRPSAGDPMIMATSLVVNLDEKGEIVNASSYVIVEEETIEEAVLKAK